MRTSILLTLLAAPLALTACNSGDTEMPMQTDEMAMDSADMPVMRSEGNAQTGSAEGTVTAIDPEAGTITIEHGPVEAVDWPAMTMAFESNDMMRTQVAEGDDVTFQFRTTDAGGEIVSITKK